jgi:hypothetical protein
MSVLLIFNFMGMSGHMHSVFVSLKREAGLLGMENTPSIFGYTMVVEWLIRILTWGFLM